MPYSICQRAYARERIQGACTPDTLSLSCTPVLRPVIQAPGIWEPPGKLHLLSNEQVQRWLNFLILLSAWSINHIIYAPEFRAIAGNKILHAGMNIIWPPYGQAAGSGKAIDRTCRRITYAPLSIRSAWSGIARQDTAQPGACVAWPGRSWPAGPGRASPGNGSLQRA